MTNLIRAAKAVKEASGTLRDLNACASKRCGQCTQVLAMFHAIPSAESYVEKVRELCEEISSCERLHKSGLIKSLARELKEPTDAS